MKLTIKQMFWIIVVAILLGAFCGLVVQACFGAEIEIDISRIIQIESSGNPNAYNPNSGAIGLMQITPICLEEWNNYLWGEGINIGQLYDPYWNVRVGTWYINVRIPQMLKAYGLEDTVDYRLIAYNAGIGRLRQYSRGEIRLPRETANYITKYKKLTEEK